MKHNWNPNQYLKYERQRLRPAIDLLARINIENPKIIFDLGCGPGNSTRILVERWRNAQITGVDSSLDMLKKATEDLSGPTWIEADLQGWSPKTKADVIYSNAALHWLENHNLVFPRLLSCLNPGGVFAVQMPGNYDAPSHKLIFDAARPWKEKVGQLIRANPVHSLSKYHNILTPLTSDLDIWETIYLQELNGENAVAEWLKGSALKPLLDGLADDEADAFFFAYSELAQKVYKQRADGITLYPFRRIFIVARK